MSQPDIACRGLAATSGPWNPNRRYGRAASGVTAKQVANLISSFVDSFNGAPKNFENGFYTISE